MLAIAMIMRYVRDPYYIKHARVGRMDKIGFGLLAIWLATLQIILDKGQEDDWFGATWIRWGTVILIVAFVAFIIWEWNKHQPLVNLRVFRNRNFAVGCLLIALFGGVIYGLVTLLPLFYQTLLGYTALLSGIAVSPRGLGAIVAMPMIGLLTSRIDNRWLIAFGFALFAGCSFWFADINLVIGQWTLTWAIILSGFASGCVFVPLSTTAMAQLPNEQIGNASGLYNLLRNIGGSIGISMIETILSRHEQIHRADLAHNLNPDNRLFTQQLSGLATYIQQVPYQDLYLPAQRALDIVDQSLSQQAALLSFVDDFRYLGLVCIVCVPLVFLLKKALARKGAVSAAH